MRADQVPAPPTPATSARLLLEALKSPRRGRRDGAGCGAGQRDGPAGERAAQERAQGMVPRAVAAGARAVVDRSTRGGGRKEGGSSSATMLDEVATGLEIYLTEVFGPVSHR